MKKYRNKIHRIFMLAGILLLSNIIVLGQSANNLTASGTLPNGLPNTGQALTATSYCYIFAYSGFNSNNALILNGISVPITGSGWYDGDGYHSTSNQNYFCEQYDNYGYHNFLAFDLSNLSSYGITTPITSAVLHVYSYDIYTDQGRIYYQLSSVDTDWSVINQNYSSYSAQGLAIYDDLAEGTTLGYIIADNNDDNTFLDITLNSDAISDINASVGTTYVLGGSAMYINAIPVPYWLIVLGFLLIATAVIFRFKFKKA